MTDNTVLMGRVGSVINGVEGFSACRLLADPSLAFAAVESRS